MKSSCLSARRLLLIGAIVLVLVAIAIVAIQLSTPPTNPTTTKTVIFDFDAGYQLPYENLNTPFNQTSDGIEAYFSSPSDPAAFSVQSYGTTFFNLSQFSGKYLYDNKPSRDILEIKFDAEIIAINFTFATAEVHGGAITVPSDILLTAYKNTNLVGSTKAYGMFSGDSFPQGILSFSSGRPFNLARISMPAQTSGITDFLIDNIVVTVVATP